VEIAIDFPYLSWYRDDMLIFVLYRIFTLPVIIY